MKKVLLVGANGNIGKFISEELSHDTEVISVGHQQGDFQVDLADPVTIKALFKKTGPIDAVICAASRGVVFKPISEMTIEDYEASTKQKLFGQITLALEAMKHLKDKGSVTLTSGCMNVDFVKDGSAAAMINNAIEGFVKAAALDAERGIRLNIVSPDLLEVSAEAYKDYFPGFNTVPGDKVAKAYRKSVYGMQTGQVYRVK